MNVNRKLHGRKVIAVRIEPIYCLSFVNKKEKPLTFYEIVYILYVLNTYRKETL